MIHQFEGKAEKSSSDIREINHQDHAPLVLPIGSDPKYIKISRQVVLKMMCEAPLLICTQAPGLIVIVLCEKEVKNHASTMAKGIMNVYLCQPFCIIIFNIGKVDVQLPEYQKLSDLT